MVVLGIMFLVVVVFSAGFVAGAWWSGSEENQSRRHMEEVEGYQKRIDVLEQTVVRLRFPEENDGLLRTRATTTDE